MFEDLYASLRKATDSAPRFGWWREAPRSAPRSAPWQVIRLPEKASMQKKLLLCTDPHRVLPSDFDEVAPAWRNCLGRQMVDAGLHREVVLLVLSYLDPRPYFIRKISLEGGGLAKGRVRLRRTLLHPDTNYLILHRGVSTLFRDKWPFWLRQFELVGDSFYVWEKEGDRPPEGPPEGLAAPA
jgi:hypothetical protein